MSASLKAAYGILALVKPCGVLHRVKRMRPNNGFGGGNESSPA